jgi:hypothetical protein
MSRYTHFTKLKHLIFLDGGSNGVHLVAFFFTDNNTYIKAKVGVFNMNYSKLVV